MKPFEFQKFTVKQSQNVFRIGTDAVLLGAMADAPNYPNILEVGTGTGIISLMLAQRNPRAQITAIDLDENAVHLASENFLNSVYTERLSVQLSDFKSFESEKKFDLIVSNPPYFDKNASSRDKMARQTVELSHDILVKNARKNLKNSGILSVILPAESAHEFIKILEKENFSLTRKVNIYGIKGGKLKRNILESSPTAKMLVEDNLIIEKSPRKFTDQYLALTKKFHKFV